MLIHKERIPVLHILLVGLWPSFIKKLIYRVRGYHFDRGVKIRFGAVLIGKKVLVGEKVSLGFFCIVRGTDIDIRRFARVGAFSVIDTAKIFIDEDARINEQVYIGGMKTPASSIHLGKRTIIMQLSYLNPTMPIVIGDDSGIGGHCLFFTHGSWNSELEGYPVRFGAITLGKKVWLPWRVFVMPGVTIGDGAVIGANSLVTSDIPAHTMAAGSPAKVIKENFPAAPAENEQRKIVERILLEFTEFMKFEEMSVRAEAMNGGIKYIINGKGRRGEIKYIESLNISAKNTSTCAVLSWNCSPESMNTMRADGTGMILSLGNNLRCGSNDAGEELSAYLSRHGIRFGRID